jgi:hypothetical protein
VTGNSLQPSAERTALSEILGRQQGGANKIKNDLGFLLKLEADSGSSMVTFLIPIFGFCCDIVVALLWLQSGCGD